MNFPTNVRNDCICLVLKYVQKLRCNIDFSNVKGLVLCYLKLSSASSRNDPVRERGALGTLYNPASQLPQDNLALKPWPAPLSLSLCYPQSEGRWRVAGRGGEARAGQTAQGNSGYCNPDEVESELMAVGSWEGIGKQRPGWKLVTL